MVFVKNDIFRIKYRNLTFLTMEEDAKQGEENKLKPIKKKEKKDIRENKEIKEIKEPKEIKIVNGFGDAGQTSQTVMALEVMILISKVFIKVFIRSSSSFYLWIRSLKTFKKSKIF